MIRIIKSTILGTFSASFLLVSAIFAGPNDSGGGMSPRAKLKMEILQINDMLNELHAKSDGVPKIGPVTYLSKKKAQKERALQCMTLNDKVDLIQDQLKAQAQGLGKYGRAELEGELSDVRAKMESLRCN